MAEKIKIGSVISQSNVGSKYEDRVAAWAYTKLVLRHPTPGLVGEVVRVWSQSGHEVKKLDDLVLDLRGGDQTLRVLLQAKLQLQFTKGDKNLAETVQAIANRISDRDTSDNERYAIAFQQNDNGKRAAFQRLLDLSLAIPSCSEWLARVHVDKHLDDMFKVLKAYLSADTTDEVIYTLCRKTVIWNLELFDPLTADADYCIEALRPYVNGGGPARRLFWNTLVDVASRTAAARGAHSRESLLQNEALQSLYREPVRSDATANVVGTIWLNERSDRVTSLENQLRRGHAYEALLEIETSLSEMSSLLTTHSEPTPSRLMLQQLIRRLVTIQGRAFLVLDFKGEYIQWIENAKMIAGNDEDLWIQIGRVSVDCEDHTSLEESCANVRDHTQLTLLRMRQALLREDEASARIICESLNHDSKAEAGAALACWLIDHLKDSPLRLSEAMALAKAYALAHQERPMAQLLYASTVFIATCPGPSPLYTSSVTWPDGSLRSALKWTLETLTDILTGDYGVYEKAIALTLLVPVSMTVRNNFFPLVSVLETPPPYLERASVLRTIGYSQAMLTLGRTEQAEVALRRRLVVETDLEERVNLQNLLMLATSGAAEETDDDTSSVQSFWAQLIKALRRGECANLLSDSEEFRAKHPDSSFGLQSEVLAWLCGGDVDLVGAVSNLIDRFPHALETHNISLDLLVERYHDEVKPSQRTIESMVAVKNDARTMMERAIKCLSKHLAVTSGSENALCIWLELAVNTDDNDALHEFIRTSREMDFEALAALGEAWLASDCGDFHRACDLIERFAAKYRLSPSIRDLHDRCAIQAGETTKLADNRSLLIANKNRLPGTAKYTVQSLILEGMPAAAVEIARANMEDFPDDRIAMRDFLYVALQLRRLDAAPEALERFHSLYPDDQHIWKVELSKGRDIISEMQEEGQEKYKAYEALETPFNFLGRPLIEEWLHLLERKEGVQVRRLGMAGTETSFLEDGTRILLDYTALLACSRFQLFDRLSTLKLFTSKASLLALRRDVRAMRMRFNAEEHAKHQDMLELRHRGNIELHEVVPDAAMSLLQGPQYTLGEADNAIASFLSAPIIETRRKAEYVVFSLPDLLLSMYQSGRLRFPEYERAKRKLKDLHPDVYSNDPLFIENFNGIAMIGDGELRDLSECGIASDILEKLDKVIIGPSSCFAFELLSQSHLQFKRNLDLATEYLGLIEKAVAKQVVSIVSTDNVPEMDEVQFLRQLVDISYEFDVFWCDDVILRSVVGAKNLVTTTSTPQVTRFLLDRGALTLFEYRDLMSSIGSSGYRDIDGSDLLVSCVINQNFASSHELRRSAFHLGRSMKVGIFRDKVEQNLAISICCDHLLSLLVSCAEADQTVMKDACLAISAGAGIIGGRVFWETFLKLAREKLSASKMGLVEVTVAGAGQLDLSAWADAEIRRQRGTQDRPLITLPSLDNYLRSLHLA